MSRPDVIALLGLTAYFLIWFWPALTSDRIYVGEDLVGKYYAMRHELYRMAHGIGFTWWNPLPGLGMPRLGNVEHGCFSPVSLLFYLLPTTAAFRVYPLAIFIPMAAFTYALFRARGLAPLPSVFGSLAYVTVGTLQDHIQHPPIVETLLWLPASLLCWAWHVRTGRLGWIALGGIAVAFQCFGGFPQYLLYGFLVMGFWMAIDLWHERAWKTAAAAAAMLSLGLLLGSWQLLPSLEMAGLSQRTLLEDPARFADSFRAAPWEVALSLAGEAYAFIEAPRLAYGPQYANHAQLSLLILGLALLALASRPRPWGAWLAAGFFLLGMMGSAGGVTPLLGKVLPFVAKLRAPSRMIVPASFFLAWLAALGLHRWTTAGGRRSAWAAGAVVWVAATAWAWQGRLFPWVPPSTFEVPPAVRDAEPRLAADIADPATRPPYFCVNAGLVVGKASLVFVETLIPRNYFEAMFASQIGSLDQKSRIEILVSNFNIFPLVRPGCALMRSFGLRSLIRLRDGQVVAAVQPALPMFRMAGRGRVGDRSRLHALAASNDWDPATEVLLEQPVDGLPGRDLSEAKIEVVSDAPDVQALRVESAGGLQVTSGLFYPGWEVRVDGVPARALQVNLALRAVVVPPGSHTVEWTFRPRWLSRAVGCTAGAVVILGCLLWAAWRQAASPSHR